MLIKALNNAQYCLIFIFVIYFDIICHQVAMLWFVDLTHDQSIQPFFCK